MTHDNIYKNIPCPKDKNTKIEDQHGLQKIMNKCSLLNSPCQIQLASAAGTFTHTFLEEEATYLKYFIFTP